MVGEAARLTRSRAALAFLVALTTTAFAAASRAAWDIEATCRDGRAQGPYQLRSGDGQLRVAGAFNEGKRTGSFIFWATNGVRAAHIPYDEDARNGTIATWYPGVPGREPARHFESTWRRDAREGITRSWYADGRHRAETEYAQGRIVASVGWSDSGERLSDAAAREVAQRDADALDALYADLDALIREHLPRCD
jgi:hypothetical protein